MKIISFAHTTPALLAGRKTVTRREWNPRYAQSFEAGDLVQAYDRSPRIGGKKVCEIRLTREPYLSNEYPEEDFEGEGFRYFEQVDGSAAILGLPARELWAKWQRERPYFWVVRFELVEAL